MILTDILRAIGQFGDARFQSVFWRGVGLTVLLFGLLMVGAVWLVDTILPAHFTLPWIGAVGGVHWLAGGVALLSVTLLSGFLMVPVAAAFTSLFLDEVAEAVEARHYPGLPPARAQGWAEIIGAGLRLAVLSLIVNLVALVFYALSGPLAPFLFWAVNGYLLGRDFAEGAASRRLPAPDARALVRRNIGQVWALGVLVALPLSVPILGLVVPILAAAAFTHLIRRLPQAGPSAGR
ncbi:MAG: EI24 domain-containing protein [Paracoccaceae bacterium]|nr:EI24 domain-containing protein [Paracoccaceae bacterium]MDE3240259.1 EI24 domain-containing protein [Paracoccaceae bacterium]